MINPCPKRNIFLKWLFWHFIDVPKAIVLGWKNFLKFNLYYFSIGVLIKSLLSPWRGDVGDYGRGFDAKRYFETFLGNMISRVLGAIIRLVIIAIGLVMQVCIFFAGLFILILWIFLPAVVVVGFFTAIGSESSWSKYLALLCFLIIVWEAKRFFEKSVKNSKLKYSLKQGLANPKDFKWIGFLDYTAGKIFKKAKSKDALLILLAKSKSPDIVFVFQRAELSQKKLQKFCLEELNKIKENEIGLEKIIIEAAASAGASADAKALADKSASQREKITPGDLLVAFAALDPVLEKFLVENDFKKDDIKNLVDWFCKEKNRREKLSCWWDYTNLLTRGSVGQDFAAGYTITLDRFSFDWRNKIGKNVFREVIGHQEEIKQTERILEKEQTKNVLLVGEPGTGRNSIVEAMAQRAFLGISTPSINHKRILQFDIESLMAQAQSKEEEDALLEKCFSEAIKAKNVILAINDFHNYVSISGIMARYLPLPSFQVVATTTFDGFHTFIERNSSFSNLFEKIDVTEISEQDTLVLMEQFVPFFEAKHKKYISFRALKEILKVSSRYMAQKPFPEKATRLLDEAMVYLKMYTKDNALRANHIRKIVSEKTKIPLEALESKEKQILLNLEDLIHTRLINQVEAVSDVSSALRRARSEVNLKSGPIGSFLFLGPTGVGKTETAKALAEIYFGNEQNMIRFDMSEFQVIEDIKRLIGTSQENGLLTTKIKEKPFSLLLLDELEKAHPNVLTLFLQVLDEGWLTDGLGRRVDFKNTIIIATSNVASEVIMEDVKQGSALDKIKEHVFNYAFSQRLLRPEFVNRFDAVVLFKPLGKLELLQIAGLMLNKLAKNLLDKGIKFSATQELKEKIVELSYNPAFGAREMKRVIQDKVENNLAKALLLGDLKRGKIVSVDPVDFSLKIL
ncbi:MAG: ATP-dependent Clp protease ATP-binding subunit [bacterium]|nr:ATP-dependent Clp protease ATP-binding subunit [bacterium]